MTLGKTDKEIYDVLSALQGLDGVQLFSVSGDIDSVTTSLQNLGLATSDDYTSRLIMKGLEIFLPTLVIPRKKQKGLLPNLAKQTAFHWQMLMVKCRV